MTSVAPEPPVQRRRVHVTRHAVEQLARRYPQLCPPPAQAVRVLTALYHQGREIGERVCNSAFVVLAKWKTGYSSDTLIALSCHVEADDTVNIVTILYPSELRTPGFIRL